MAFGGGRAEPVAMTPARFDGWYAEFRSPLRAYLRRVAQNPAAADDLFQETWIRLLTHPPSTLESTAVRAYLFTIATRLVRDSWRHESWIGRWLRTPRRQAGGEELRDENLDRADDRSPAPDARYEAREELARSFRSLTARERMLLWLAHVEQYDHREIAAMMGIRPESVRVLLYRGRQRALAALRGPASTQGGSR
jgi:RNA polymerase sigma-70 factor (ECF subfamily)